MPNLIRSRRGLFSRIFGAQDLVEAPLDQLGSAIGAARFNAIGDAAAGHLDDPDILSRIAVSGLFLEEESPGLWSGQFTGNMGDLACAVLKTLDFAAGCFA